MENDTITQINHFVIFSITVEFNIICEILSILELFWNCWIKWCEKDKEKSSFLGHARSSGNFGVSLILMAMANLW
jgi:hypothetical protein